ncbi:MAG: DNA-directed RNA polymerase subunit omega [Planctomycetota bacterium]|jgi:DNA-directed RNA polymerase subunit omega
MIEALKSDELVNKVGGRFKLTALIQRRLVELVQGQRPLVDRKGPDGRALTDMEIVIEEILTDKISIDYEKSDVTTPEELAKHK